MCPSEVARALRPDGWRELMEPVRAAAASLAAAVERLARDPGLRARMSANAKRLAAEFAPERQYGRFADVLERLAQRRRSTQ